LEWLIDVNSRKRLVFAEWCRTGNKTAKEDWFNLTVTGYIRPSNENIRCLQSTRALRILLEFARNTEL